MRAGASGFLLKHTPPAEIAHAVRRVAAGRADAVAGGAAPDDGPSSPTRSPTRAGTGPARRCWPAQPAASGTVALLVGAGPHQQEIGTALRMSTATVKAYVSRILTKLDLTNRVQVALLVHDAG